MTTKIKTTIQVIDDNITIFDGKTGLDDVNERMGLELPEDEADTIGGFVFGLLGHQGERGEHATWENLTFVVEETDGRRITRVRVFDLSVGFYRFPNQIAHLFFVRRMPFDRFDNQTVC